MNVALRAAVPADAEWLVSWLPPLAATVGYDAAMLIERVGAKSASGVRVIVRDGIDAGVLSFREHRPARGSAIIDLVAMPARFARRGSGARAAALLEERLRRRGMRTLYAPAPEQHGIGVYFWIRLGYRPLPRADWPCETSGVAWFMRRI